MLDSKILGQLLLMQSIMINLPDESSIFSFICRGLVDLPGVIEVKYFPAATKIKNSDIVKFPLQIEDSDFGEIQFKIDDFDAFIPYQEYLENFIFMIKIILEERNQRQQNILHQALLAERVEERTQQLSDEIKERNQAEKKLRIALTKYKTLFNTIPIGVTVSDEAGNIIESNLVAEKLLGLSQKEQTQRSIDGEEWQIVRVDGTIMPPEEFASVRALKEKQLVENVEMGIVKSQDETTWISVTADLLPLEGYGVVIAYNDISERKRAEEELKNLLTEKEILLAEVHHRVKNNLQVVASLLNLQAVGVVDESILAVLVESRNRIQSMTLVHEQLYRSNEYAHIDLNAYIDQLVSTLFNMYEVEPDQIQLKIDAKDVNLDLDRAIPCGMLLNELITNSLKYAFPQDTKGQINIKIRPSGEQLLLEFSDNGVGLPKHIDFHNTHSLGLQLIYLLTTHDLHGNITIDRAKGTKYLIEIPISASEKVD